MDDLETGKILVGGVGSGKTRVALAYKAKKEADKKLYIITTARKRDTHDWEDEAISMGLKTEMIVDSWNNIKKYIGVTDGFFVFDEQRVVGSGTWVKAFIKITKNNPWILLSATPGDIWMDYYPVFAANKFYKNITEFRRMHVIYDPYSKFPKIVRYINISRLKRLRQDLLIAMPVDRHTVRNREFVNVYHDEKEFFIIKEKRWNVQENKPIKDIAEAYRLMRKCVNSDPSRIMMVERIFAEKSKLIIFYNFNYELDLLRDMCNRLNVKHGEWNGHKHEPIPETDEWIYLVQYTAGAEGWNCVATDTILFYSLNYSFKITEQSEGRIDRINSPFINLYYYYLVSNSFIDDAITRSLKKKKNFQEISY